MQYDHTIGDNGNTFPHARADIHAYAHAECADLDGDTSVQVCKMADGTRVDRKTTQNRRH